MKAGLISIIIPVYKVEKYIQQCLESVLTQDYSNIEVILVDDGSPDLSGDICDKFAVLDKRIKVIHKKNGGVSSARNTGMEIMNGEWVLFIDSDDYVSTKLVSDYTNIIKDIEYNCIIFQGYKIFYDNVFTNIMVDDKKFHKHQFANALKYLHIDNDILGYSCSKIFNTSIIKTKKLKFDQNISLSEDLVFTLNYLTYCDTIYTIRKSNYFYRYDNPNGLTKKKYDYNHITKIINNTHDLFSHYTDGSGIESEFEQKKLDSLFCALLSLLGKQTSKYNLRFKLEQINLFKETNNNSLLSYTNRLYDLSLKLIMNTPPIISHFGVSIILYCSNMSKRIKTKWTSLRK